MKTLENQSLDRGIRLMEILAREGACSLAALHGHSGIPKSSIRRLLGTLIARRVVRRSLSDGLYRTNVFLPAASGQPVPSGVGVLVDVGLPHLSELTRRVSWPSDIHAIDRDRMLLVDSTRPLSPFHLYRGVVNRPVSMFGSATGQSCLASMSDGEIAEVHRRTASDPHWGLGRFRMSLPEFMRYIEKTRERGYGVRLPGYNGETVLDDGLAAIAVPIFIEGRPAGAATLIWARVFKAPEAFAEEYLPALRQTAEAINDDLRQFGA